MSLQVIKAGIMDSIQDAGRFGYQHLGINPGGVMDVVAMAVANVLVNNKPNEGVLEIHFPAAEILFKEDALIALSGGDFNAFVDDIPVPDNQPILVQRDCILRFTGVRSGARVYLAVNHGFNINPWLGSTSTNLKAGTGGYFGRLLRKNDVIEFTKNAGYNNKYVDNKLVFLPWRANIKDFYHEGPLRFIPGPEYVLLDSASKQSLQATTFNISNQSDRMGYRLNGSLLIMQDKIELVSSGVTKGTIQLLPSGQVIVLMADHQTTGGYPRIGHVVASYIPSLAQKRAGESITFESIDVADAEKLDCQQYLNLRKLQNACNFRFSGWLPGW